MTSLGKVIRRLSLDEAPQVFNVLLGDISAVGPRIPSQADWYNGIVPKMDQYPYSNYLDLLDQGLKFGATGLYVVMGRHKLDLGSRIALELIYAQKASLIGDLKIMALTALAAVKLTGKWP